MKQRTRAGALIPEELPLRSYEDYLKWGDFMDMVDAEMRCPPRILPVESFMSLRGDRTEDEILELFMDAANSPNPPGWLPEVAYSVTKYAEKKGQITPAQWRMMRKIYETLCWSGQLYDPRYQFK